MALHWNIENCNENDCWYKIPKAQLEKEAKEKRITLIKYKYSVLQERNVMTEYIK